MAFEAAPDHAPPDGGQSDPGSERFAFLAHELRNLINTAILAFDVLKTGNVGVSGVTSAVLHRSLLRADELISRALAEVRLDQGRQDRAPFLVGKFIEELAPVATLVASAQDVRLMVLPVDDALTIEADRQIRGADEPAAERGQVHATGVDRHLAGRHDGRPGPHARPG